MGMEEGDGSFLVCTEGSQPMASLSLILSSGYHSFSYPLNTSALEQRTDEACK